MNRLAETRRQIREMVRIEKTSFIGSQFHPDRRVAEYLPGQCIVDSAVPSRKLIIVLDNAHKTTPSSGENVLSEYDSDGNTTVQAISASHAPLKTQPVYDDLPHSQD